ncbi:MAG: GntR family transcriptional regulator [Acidobacteria bacterium]|nr:GntR family transcriptional regulator [Acidobacteriota bacterium]
MTQDTYVPAERRTVAETVRERLVDAIRRGEIAPGEPIPAERELCTRFQVGRTSVREAIQGLASAGWVQRRGNRMVVVERLPEVTIDGSDRRKATVRKLFEVRRVIEPVLAGLASERATDEACAEIWRIANLRTQSIDEFRRIDSQFHSLIAASCGNDLLAEVYSKALAALFRSDEFSSLLYDDANAGEVANIICSSSAAHVEIARALCDRDRPATESAVNVHLSDVERRMIEQLS